MPSGISKTIKTRPRQKTKQTSTMAVKGVNLRDLPQLYDPSYASLIRNYIIDGEGQLEKRKGMKKILEVAGGAPITMLKKFTDNVWMFAYGTTLASYTVSTNTVASLKTNFAASITDGVKYGDYFFTCNGVGGDKIYYTELSAMTPTEIAAAPKCETLYVFESRLFAGNTDTDSTEVHACAIDDGTNPPFGTWTPGLAAGDPFKIRYRVAGDVKSISSLGKQIFVLYEDGRAAFTITSIDVGGTLTLDTPVSFQQLDFGGFRGAVTTPKGVFYVNEAGVWQLVATGLTNTPLSENIVEASLLLGRDFFNDISFENADIVYDLDRHLVLITCALESSVNNIQLVLNIDTKAWAFFTGQNISRYMRIGKEIYGSDANDTIVYQLFKNHSDNSKPIYHEYIQEVPLNAFDQLSDLHQFVMQCGASSSSDIKVGFDTYTRDGVLVKDKVRLQFPTSGASASGSSVGVGSATVGTSGLGAIGRVSPLKTILAHTRDDIVIHEVWRAVIRIYGNDKAAHTVNMFALTVVDRDEQIKLNNFTKIT